MTFGLDSTGLTVKVASDVLADLRVAAKDPSGLGPTASTAADGPFGKILGLTSIELALVWALMRQVYDSFDPDQAEGEQLDNLCAVVGVTRLPATYTTGPLTLTGTGTTVIPAGSIVRITGGARFLLVTQVTIPGGGSVSGNFIAETSGPIEATAGAITDIVTAISGWTGITHSTDFAPGRNVELDSALRLRRELSLQSIGAGPDQAIRARILAIPEVIDAKVLSNRTLVTDVYGIPAKAFRAIVWSGSTPAAASADIANAIWMSAPAGIYIDGPTTVVVTDTQGILQGIRFSLATERVIYLEVDVTTDADYPIDGDAQVEAALLAARTNPLIGVDVILLDFVVAAASIAGVVGVSVRCKLDSAPGGGDTVNIAIDVTEVATLISANITVLEL